MREGVKARLAVVVTNAGVSNSSEGHGLDKQMNVHLINGSASERQAREKMIDGLLVAAEEETGERFGGLFHLPNGGIHILVSEDGENRPKDLVLHDWVVPCDRIQDCGIEVACLAVGRTAGYNLAR